jgi:hypothetical protein
VNTSKSEAGSIAPLGIGLILLSVAMMLTILSSASLFIFQKRLTTIAESAALFAVAKNNEDAGSVEFLSKTRESGFINLSLKNLLLPDHQTIEVQACAIWQPPVISFSELTSREVCSRASARAGN